MTSKATWRARLRQQRVALSPAERLARSQQIIKRLRGAMDWHVVHSLHCYEPIKRLGEIDISDFVTALQQEQPEIEICTSRKLHGTWQVVSADGQPVGDMQFDVIIVPMLGFDPASLHRLGYGGGYYDRLLAAQPQARKIGVCFELGRVENLPHEPHDIALDEIITEMSDE